MGWETRWQEAVWRRPEGLQWGIRACSPLLPQQTSSYSCCFGGTPKPLLQLGNSHCNSRCNSQGGSHCNYQCCLHCKSHCGSLCNSQCNFCCNSHCNSLCNSQCTSHCGSLCISHCKSQQDLGAGPAAPSLRMGFISASAGPVAAASPERWKGLDDFFFFFSPIYDLADKLARGISGIKWIIASDRRRSHSPFQPVHLRVGKKHDEAGTLSSCLSFLTVHCATVDALAAFWASLHVN